MVTLKVILFCLSLLRGIWATITVLEKKVLVSQSELRFALVTFGKKDNLFLGRVKC